VATFADDTAILAVGADVEEATEKLQHAADSISSGSSNSMLTNRNM